MVIFPFSSLFLVTVAASVPVPEVMQSVVDPVADGVVSAQPLAAHASHFFFSLFLQADIVVKIVIVGLLLASIWTWAVIFDKFMFFKALNKKMRRFSNIFETVQSIAMLQKYLSKTVEAHPMAAILRAAVEEWNAPVSAKGGVNREPHHLKERIWDAMGLAVGRTMDSVSCYTNSLATIATTAPFVGLFGTVWGIMIGFQAIATVKAASLATVAAPCIAEALLATAFGFIAAIPATVFYNKFSSEAGNIANKLEDFRTSLMVLILRDL